eukprot:1189986-Prorocentrum_minimum.AAC.1
MATTGVDMGTTGVDMATAGVDKATTSLGSMGPHNGGRKLMDAQVVPCGRLELTNLTWCAIDCVQKNRLREQKPSPDGLAGRERLS